LLPVSTTRAANLPPVSTNFTSVVDTGGKFAIGFNDTGGKSTTPVANNGTSYQTADNLE
jgi:hypothetical protein